MSLFLAKECKVSEQSRKRYVLSFCMWLTALGFLCACGGSQPKPQSADGDAHQQGSLAAQRDVDLKATNASAKPCQLETVYFTFDSSTIEADSKIAIQRAVTCYQKQGAPARLHLVGATDPQGTEEYNIALGDRRARAVKEYLISLGIGDTQISVASVGEEMSSESEDEWAKNRQVTSTPSGQKGDNASDDATDE